MVFFVAHVGSMNKTVTAVARMSKVLLGCAIVCAFSVIDLPCFSIDVLQAIPIFFQPCQRPRIQRDPNELLPHAQMEVQPLSATELNHLGRILQGQFGQLEAVAGWIFGERTSGMRRLLKVTSILLALYFLVVVSVFCAWFGWNIVLVSMRGWSQSGPTNTCPWEQDCAGDWTLGGFNWMNCFLAWPQWIPIPY